MTPEEYLAHGNHFRSINEPEKAIACYAQAFVLDPNYGAAYNNYGNVIREMGHPERAYGFLQNAIAINENDTTAQFNLAVAYLLAGDLERGWKQYEKRWQYEHLAGQLPQFKEPRWEGQDLQGKTILVTGEQGHGDNIQFCRFVEQLIQQGAYVILSVEDPLVYMLESSFATDKLKIIGASDELTYAIDYWSPIMSLPNHLNVTYKNLPYKLQYLNPSKEAVKHWMLALGHKTKVRVGFSWSGRRDSWINQHKAIPFETMLNFIKRNPEYDWYNLQMDCTEEEEAALDAIGVHKVRDRIGSWDDTAGIVHHMDVVISVDTSVGHLAGAMGRPFWLPLNWFGQCWRWLTKRNDSPWYPSCRIFRQPKIGDWSEPLSHIETNLKLIKI